MSTAENKLVIKLVKPTETGNLVMWITVIRNPVLDWMQQAAQTARPYIAGGWQMAHVHIE